VIRAHRPFAAILYMIATTSTACTDAPSASEAASSESGAAGGRCVAADDGRGCRCGADVSEIADWHEVEACDTAPSGSQWTCCDGTGSCACGVPRCLEFGGGKCLCAAFVESPPDATAEVDSCTALVCCDRGNECECSGAVLTCTAAGTVDECVPPPIGACGEDDPSVTACNAQGA
jgi:hypothetical protein